MVLFTCQYCAFSSRNQRSFVKHMRRHEKIDPYFLMVCPTCAKNFKDTRSWNRHMVTHSMSSSPNEADLPTVETHGDSDHSAADESAHAPVPSTSRTMPSDATAGSSVAQNSTNSQSQNHMCQFFLNLKARNVPQAICNDIVAEFKTFASNVVSECSKKIQETCPEQHAAIDLESLPSVARLHQLDQMGKLENFASSELLLVKPKSVVLVNATADGKVRSCQFVSVRRQLEVLMANANFRESIQLSCCATSGSDETVYADINDGTAHKTDEENVIRLVLYFDEFQVSCIVGNKTRKYSIGAVYFAVANLPQRSRLDEIHLALLFHKNHIERCNWDQLLRPVVDELKGLESDGLNVLWKGELTCIKVHVELLIGDNLGIHSITGLYSSFRNTSRLCRMCHATAEDMQTKFKEFDFKMRSKNEYAREIEILEQEQYHPEVQKIFGINHACVLNELESFHTSGQTPFDCSHDLFEGVVIYALNTIFTSLVSHRIIDKAMITKMVTTFPYHRVDINRPQPPTCNAGDVKFKETCSESWTLIRLVPLMLKQVAEDEVLAKCKLSLIADLIEIVQRIMAHSFSDADVDALDNMIERWLHSFKSEFPLFRLKPKFHYLIHYGSQIKAHGPPRKYMTIRFEAKHQSMKNFLSTSKNRKNVCLTMAKKHQLMMCVAQSKPSYLMGGIDRRSVQHLPGLPNIADMWDGPIDDLIASKRVTHNGTKYVLGDVLVLNISEEFCALKRLEHIILNSDTNDCRLICSHLEVVAYCNQLQAFRVAPSNSLNCFHFDALADPHPLGIYHIRGNEYVVIKTWLSRRFR